MIDEAIQQMQIAVSDSYDSVSVFSIYWKSNDTGSGSAREDSSLFIDTLSRLHNVKSYQRSLDNDVTSLKLASEIAGAVSSQSGCRKLFILHYAGHTIAGSTPDYLIITPKVGGGRPEMDISLIKDLLKDTASKSLEFDVLLVIDFCCARIAGQGEKAEGARVELMAATARKDISNKRKDGRTFTQHWCETFTRLLEMGEPFTCDDIVKDTITPDSEPEQFPTMFVLREGWNLPITFRPRPSPIASPLPAAVTSQTVITVLHIEENPDSAPLKKLIKYLDDAPVKITVLAVLPVSTGTLLLLRIPVVLQDLLVLPRVAFTITDS